MARTELTVLRIVQSHAPENWYVFRLEGRQELLDSGGFIADRCFACCVKDVRARDDLCFQAICFLDFSDIEVGGWKNRFTIERSALNIFEADETFPCGLHFGWCLRED